MATILDRLFGREPEQKAVVTGNGGTGAGVLAFYNDTPVWTASRNHARLMKQAQGLYHDDLIIHAAENKVSGRAAGLPWHLEDEAGDEITDESDPKAKIIRDWLEKPQAALTDRKPMTRRELWKLTHRHDGLCGTTFWYLDQRTLLTGVPGAALYINPARMTAVQNEYGILRSWKLDADDEGNGGIPLELGEVLQFVYDPPDWGHYGVGLVESAGIAASLTRGLERHVAQSLANGGRLPGIIAPKVGVTVTDDQWAAFVKDWRNIASDPDSAKRLQIARAPIDYNRTAGTPQELAVEAVAKMSREDKLALWGVPESQLPLPSAGGLNSGETKGYDEAVLMQGAVHDRVIPFVEAIQFQVLDAIAAAGGPKLQLIVEEPEFDDETPLYDRAQKARELPLTRNERRAQVGLDPLPDYDLEGNPLGTAIDLPIGLTVVGAGPDENGKLQPLPQPDPPPAPLVPVPPDGPPSPEVAPAKAQTQRRLLGLRDTVETRYVPSTQRDVQRALSEQSKAVAKRVRARGAANMSTGSWWDESVEDARIRKAIEPHNVGIAEIVSEHVEDFLGKPPAKADTFVDTVMAFVRKRTGERVKDINRTTRERIARIIDDGFAQGLGPTAVADLIESATPFDESRAEMVARTETMLAYNEASLSSFGEFGVTEVEAIDGDDDEECASRDGQTFPITEAFEILDHPNGTLDWSPVIKAEPVPDEGWMVKALLEHALQPTPTPVINFTAPPVTVTTPEVVVHNHPAEPSTVQVDVHIPKAEPVTKTIVRDKQGQIDRIVES